MPILIAGTKRSLAAEKPGRASIGSAPVLNMQITRQCLDISCVCSPRMRSVRRQDSRGQYLVPISVRCPPIARIMKAENSLSIHMPKLEFHLHLQWQTCKVPLQQLRSSCYEYNRPYGSREL
jgi:hypothetical protein